MKQDKEMECGCVITTDFTMDGQTIGYCPKHKAAPALYEALKAVADNITDDMGTQVNTSTQLLVYGALAKAEGKRGDDME